MLPSESEMLWCIMLDGEIVDGAGGLAIGPTELEAWGRAVSPCEEWAILDAKARGAATRRCAIMVLNP